MPTTQHMASYCGCVDVEFYSCTVCFMLDRLCGVWVHDKPDALWCVCTTCMCCFCMCRSLYTVRGDLQHLWLFYYNTYKFIGYMLDQMDCGMH